jgi:hypothetical protein
MAMCSDNKIETQTRDMGVVKNLLLNVEVK